MADHQPFPGLVCQYIRNLVKARRKCQSEREQTFEERDEASRQIGEALMASKPTEPHEAEYGRAVMRLDILAQRLKYLEGELDKAIESADEPELPFKTPKVDIPDFKPRAKSHAEKGEKKPKPEGDVEGQTKIPDAPVPTGELQHLDADPSALELPGPLLAKLRKANVTNVAQLAQMQDDDKDLRAELNLNENQASELARSLKRYRKAHRQAMLEADREGAAPKR